jgi:hypothetical protein
MKKYVKPVVVVYREEEFLADSASLDSKMCW